MQIIGHFFLRKLHLKIMFPFFVVLAKQKYYHQVIHDNQRAYNFHCD